MIDLKAKVEIIEDNLTLLTSLTNKGFVGDKCIKNPPTKILPEGYEVKFSNDSNISITITYYMVDDANEFFRIFINNQDGKSLSLFDWLKYHNKENNRAVFRLSHYDGGFFEKIKQIVERINSFLSDPLFDPILSGHDWEEIPFDWAGMR